jgi:hypothetical protein
MIGTILSDENKDSFLYSLFFFLCVNKTLIWIIIEL